jgi:protease IV
MTLETETVLDRRALRRRLGFWRSGAILAALVAAGAIAGSYMGGTKLAETRQIARVAIEGVITEDREQLRMLKRIKDAKNVQGVILYINSPGGTTTGGEALFEAVRDLAKDKPVVAQFGTVAASAAYITGLASDHIVARGNSITGSVGVIFQWPDVSQLLDKVGVKFNEIKSGPLKAVPSMYEPISPEGRKVTEAMVAESQVWFLGLVTSRRGITTANVPGLEQGRVFSGREALTHKLVDEIGAEAEAVKWMETSRSVPKGLRVVDWKPRRETDFSWLNVASQAIGGLFGFESRDVARVVGDDRLFARFTLDGMVSVWQPSDK